MCQCGCSEYPVEQAYELTRRCVLGVKVYTGCVDCFRGLAVDLSIWNSANVEWLEHLRGQIDKTVKPSEYGGSNNDCGIPVPIIDVPSLIEQAKELEADGCGMTYGEDGDGFDSVADWLDEYGFQLLQGACRKFLKKHEAQREELNSRAILGNQ